MTTDRRITRANIGIVLCRPKYSGNVGAVARAAMNMGIERLVVVGSREDLNLEEAKRTATHFATPLLEKIEIFSSLPEALADFQWIVGTTSKVGKIRRPVVHPRLVAEEIVSMARNNRVALLFGPEDNGLANEDLLHCHCLITIPADNRFSSINLSHAVMIVCYELFLAGGDAEPPFAPSVASAAMLEGMYGQLNDLLLEVGFFKDKNPGRQLLYLRRFFSRVKLTEKDVQVVRGICRQVGWYTKNKSP